MKTHRQSIFFSLLALLFACTSHAETPQEETPPTPSEEPESPRILYQQIDCETLRLAQAENTNGDLIPDFSRVGYHWGDQEIPTLPVVKTLNPPADGSDASLLIQGAIDELAESGTQGAILLTKGLYKIDSLLTIQADGIVLRGEGYSDDPTESTILYATTNRKQDLLQIGTSAGRRSSMPAESNFLDPYVPCGQFWIRVNNAASFAVGDAVLIRSHMNEQWISDLEMDQIPPRADGGEIVQWSPARYKFTPERTITKIAGDTLWFENPTVMGLDARHGLHAVIKYRFDSRTRECGVENLYVRSAYKSSQDIEHGWSAIRFLSSEHCWVRNVRGDSFAYSLVSVTGTGKNITIENCQHYEPKSPISGGYRYTFELIGQLCLVKNCFGREGRHDFLSSPANPGPNVFVHCWALNTLNDIGPHGRWNMGTLYDNVSGGEINIQDRTNQGTGHGWAGVTNVLWNCTASKKVCVQTPLASGKNYSIGTVGTKWEGLYPTRADGVWISAGTPIADTPSLYEAQLALRKRLQPGGVFDVE